jgi:hypothetical protein
MKTESLADSGESFYDPSDNTDTLEMGGLKPLSKEELELLMLAETEPDENEGGSRKLRIALPIITADLETDPFLNGRKPEPFVAGAYDGETYRHFGWGADWKPKLRAYLLSIPASCIYLHNGGKFDLFYVLDWLEGNMLMINGRIVKADSKFFGSDGKRHEFRDSYSIMPFALKLSGKKKEIDITLLEKEVRDENKVEILDYLGQDCIGLYQLVVDFRKRFGDKLTIGSTAIGELQKIHTYAEMKETTDRDIRGLYYYGGRVECLEKGKITGRLKVYDVNSMYPSVMRNVEHPIGWPVADTTQITDKTFFVSVEGQNYGAFPCREKDGGIRFDRESGIFHVTIHEFYAALRLGIFEPKRIHRCVNFDRRATFAEFVDRFYNLRAEAKKTGDDSGSLFYKLVLNSAYGKFAQNPLRYRDWKITEPQESMPTGWEREWFDPNSHSIWSRPKEIKGPGQFHNVATAASITGAARTVLMEAIANAHRPIYCDTDAIICEQLDNVPIDQVILGAWDLEKECDEAYICGKKLYALYKDGVCVKQANKGVRLTGAEIKRIALGEVITCQKDSPTFKWDGTHVFLKRRVRMT